MALKLPIVKYVTGADTYLNELKTGDILPSTFGITNVSGTYSILTTDQVILVNTSASRSLTLPTPSTSYGMYIIKDVSGLSETNPISLIRAGTEQIEGVAATRVLTDNFGVWRIISDQTNWWMV